jgi:phosphatidylinositol alpha 1,6-mannosyltransferase
LASPPPGWRSIPLPRYRTYRVGDATTRELVTVLSAYEPDIVHLAAPALLGGLAMRSARRLALPTVGVFQTDAAAFAARHGLGAFRPLIWRELRRIHDVADLTKVPSAQTHRQLLVRTRRSARPYRRLSPPVCPRWHPPPIDPWI